MAQTRESGVQRNKRTAPAPLFLFFSFPGFPLGKQSREAPLRSHGFRYQNHLKQSFNPFVPKEDLGNKLNPAQGS
ncbi:MAG TPA: hypothetical protein DD473_26530 [Planctomycetaceae bacterium]|nr:hypothetical protein [Planctomycetaceae bacterium]